jgi:ribosomal protein L37AE/L43A
VTSSALIVTGWYPTMASYLDYARRDGKRPERWPNLREAAAKPWMGQTAVIGRRPWLVVGFDGEMYELENEFGDRMRSNKFEVLEYESDNNKLVAASRIEGSPLDVGFRLAACDCAIGPLDFDRESYEWSVLTDAGTVLDMEARVAELENADWKVSETLKEAEMPAFDPIPDLKEHEYYCPECGSNDVDFGDDLAHCNDCGWHGSPDEILTEQDRAHDHIEESPRHDPYDDSDWQYAGMVKEAPADKYKGIDDPGSPKHMKGAPDKVSEIYNACMREGNGRGDTEEEKKSSCAAIAWSTYKKEKKTRTTGKAAEAEAIEQAAAQALAAGDIDRANELRNLADQKRTAKIVQEGGKFCVKSEKGKNLGCEDTMEAAKKRLREVEYFKHQGALAMDDLGIEREADYAGEGISDRKDHMGDPLKCPNCNSHTVEMVNSEKEEFHCKACGNRFKHKVLTNPKSPSDKKGAIELVMDSDGRPVASGHYYNLHGDKYKIPDIIKILEIKDGHIVATVDNNSTPIKISGEDIKSNGYSFEPLPIYSNIEQHDLREAVSWNDVKDNLETNLGWDNYPNKPREAPDAGGYSPMTDREQEYSLPTPSGGVLWVRENSNGEVTGWSVPSFDGGPGQWSIRDLDRVQSQVDQARSRSVRAEDDRPVMAKEARRAFTPGEQKKLIEEKGNARNKDKLRLDDSHYVEAKIEEDPDFLF